MPDFQQSIDVQATKQEVFDYVSKVENMPHYLPTVKEATMEDADHVHMAVEIDGKRHEDGGFFRTEQDDRLAWGSEDHDYHGEMTFQGDGSTTNVSIRLHIQPPAHAPEGPWKARIESGLSGALDAIKQRVEGVTTSRI